MRNPLTVQIETRLGIIFLILLAGFFIRLLFLLIDEFDAEVEVQAATVTQIKITSAVQKNLIDRWIVMNGIEIPNDKSRYRYVQDKYPAKPWLRTTQ